MKTFAPIAVVLLLAGCASTPTTYLALAPVPGPTVTLSGSPVAVARVAMPAAIDRLYLTTATGPTTLNVASHARWAAPLGGEARSALTLDLASRLPEVTVLMPGDPVPHGTRVVSVNVSKFLPEPGHVVLDADWRVTAGDDHRTVASGRAHIRVPTGHTPPEQAEAMSAALGRLADRIAAKLGN